MILDRIKEYIDFKKIAISAFEKSIGMSNASFGKSLKTGGAIGTDKLENILSVYADLNPMWLLTGEGSMLRTKETASVMEKTTPSVELIPSTEDNTVTIPIVEISVAAGTSGFPNSNYIEVVDGIKLPASMLHRHAQYYCVRVKGDSMVPTILDSSYVVVRLLDRAEWEDLRDHHVYVISDRDGRAYLKRLKNRFHEHGFVTCMSDNPDKVNYGNFNLMEDEINSILYAEFYISAKMPNIHETYYKQVGELRDDMDILKEQMKQVMNTIKTIN